VKRPVRVAVTRASGSAERLAERLRACGFEVAQCPLVRIEPIEGPPLRLDRYDWVTLTSAVAVELLLGRLEGELPPVAAIGPATAEALRDHGIEPAIVAPRSTQEGLVEELRKVINADTKVVFPGAEDAREVIAVELAAEIVPLYRTVELRPERFPDVDIVVLASGSAARAYAALGGRRPCVSIGPATSAEARRVGLTVAVEAATHDLEGLVDAVTLAESRLALSRS
jgi:uroporphyrinogen III methyltransferase / synthase